VAKSVVEVLVDDLDGSEAIESVRIGWNGQWRQLELSERNLAALSKAFDRFWDVARPVSSTKSRSTSASRDPKAIRAWAAANGLDVPARGRIPRDLEAQYLQAAGH